MKQQDLTKEEQAHVRTALRFLRTRCGSWATVGKAIGFRESTLSHVLARRSVTPTMAFRVARFAKVSVDDVLTGRFPAPGTCPHCGHMKGETTDA